MKRLLVAVSAVSAMMIAGIGAQSRRPLQPSDIFQLKTVADPRLSPDGAWVAYTVTTLDEKEDNSDTDIYMVSTQGGDPVRLTSSRKPETSPRWSPDGRYLAFLSSRDGKKPQVYLLDRRGGDPQVLTDYKAGASAIAWSPDSTRLALLVSDPDPNDSTDDKPGDNKEKKPKPIVIDRLQFMQDGVGYLTDLRRHIHVFDVATKKDVQVTAGAFDDGAPVWSPDGRLLAFSANRTTNADANDNSDIFVVEPTAGATPRALTTNPGFDNSPVFSPDGASIAYVAGGDPKDIWYATNTLMVVPVAGGAPKALTAGLDRNVSRPQFTPDGSGVLFLVEEGGNQHLARVPAGSGPVTRILDGEREVMAFDVAKSTGDVAILESQPTNPAEVWLAAADLKVGTTARTADLKVGPTARTADLKVGTTARTADLKVGPTAPVATTPPVVQGFSPAIQLTHVNDAFLANVALSPVERFKAKSADGTTIDCFLTRPPNARAGQKLPTVLRIHGGPVAQYSTAFNLEWQMLAAGGFAVVSANPRGSSGYGRAFSRAIFADWGNKDYDDVMAAIDAAIQMGVADPQRLGVGGWSYGGILTDHVISKTSRFKAAISGASEFNYLANYGNDHYQRQWEAELGLPWQNPQLWMKLSPFFRMDRIVTPTLVMGGDADMNVPIIGGQQLYQGLKRLGRDTELVVYPGEPHSIRRPSFQKDRLERYIAWYSKYLVKNATSTQ